MTFKDSFIPTSLLAGAMFIAGGAQAAPLEDTADGSWVTITGEVAQVSPETFLLDYGDNTLVVEMDDWDFYGEATPLVAGERVTVSGKVDKGFYESRTLEAGSVYVDSRNTYYYADPADEEEWVTYVSSPVIVGTGDIADNIDLAGVVTSTDGREFTVDTGAMEATVDTSAMAYNPMEDEGLQKIEKGDFVSVSGVIEESLFDERELVATTILSLDYDVSKSGSNNQGG